MQGEKAAFRPCAYAEGALTHHGQTLVPRADRRHLRLEGGSRCTVEPADYSTVRSIAAALELPEACPQGQVRRHLRNKRPKTKGKIEILHTVKERPKRPMRGLVSETGRTTHSWQRDPCACSCLPTGHSGCLPREDATMTAGASPRPRSGCCRDVPLETLTPKWGKQLAGHTGLTDAL
jgi:bifunctional DNA-binding transcriptional regulator/antitoxin component of YhaV-PrlF toxin-antitoxin module